MAAPPGPGAHERASENNNKIGDMDAVNSMDWFMKKERIFLLAQFWQQRAALAETEVNSLKEQLDNYRLKTKENNNNYNNISSTNSINNNNNINNTNNNNNKSRHGSGHENSDVGELDNHCTESSESNLRNTPEEEEEEQPKEIEVSKLVEDISRLQAALSGVKEATAVQMHALEEQLELKNRLIHKLELKLENNSKDNDDIKRELGNGRENRLSLEGSLGLPPRSLEGFLLERNKLEQEMKIPPSEFGNSLSHFGPSPFSHPLRHPMHQHLGTPLAPPPLMSPLQPLAPHPPPGTPLHHLLGEEWRRSLERSAMDRHAISSGQVSPDSGGAGGTGHSDRSESRDSPVGDMKSPSSLANGFGTDSKSPFQVRDDRSPFKDDLHPISYKFEDRITGESLIPKGDPMEARLQEILRYNMEKYCHQNLDTLHISRRVRELLSIHNIGQRLFAKYVLGLSQGTVSELLSKPKPWDKLTEKGRDSYRKMHAWGTDDSAVFLLKSLIPKKGSHKEGGLRPGEESVTEERIQHILSEASRAMTSNVTVPGTTGMILMPHPSLVQSQPPLLQPLPPSGTTIDQDSRSTDSKSPASSTHSPSPMSRERLRVRKDHEDMPQEKVARLYQEELVKLMSRPHHPPEAQLPLPRDPQYPGLLFPFLGQTFLFNRGQEEMKMALDAYHQELSKLQGAAVTGMGLGAAGLGMGGSHGMGGIGSNTPISMGMSLGAGGHNGAQDLSMPKREMRNGEEEEESLSSRLPGVGSPFGIPRIKPETSLTMSSAASPLTSLVTPINSITSISSANSNSSNGSVLEDLSTTTASPLQRMASITNSLMTAPPLSGGSSMNQKPMKAILPPITQQQFDQYSSMNTEDIVKKQSDPFAFMSTEDIVKKVKEQLSQYSISQRLFGESVLGLSQGSVSDLLARPKPWHMLTQKGREPFIRMKMFLEDDNAVHKLVASQYKIAPEKLMRTGGYSVPPHVIIANSNKPHHIKLPADLPKSSIMESPLPPCGIPSSLGGLTMPSHHHPYDTRIPLLDPLRKVFPFQASLAGVRVPGPVAPSVYEMAALTQDLDTQVITTKIKEALLANNIGQKLFGEAVLGLSQGSVSELLSKPKPWHMLSIKGREPFIRMQLWLNDPHNVEKLQALKNERREANKRRRVLDPSAEASPDSQDMYQVPSPGGSSKKPRVLFSEEQKEALKVAYNLDPYPSQTALEFLSQELQLSTRTISNWFHNHRMRLKQHPGSPDGGLSSSPTRDLPNPSQIPFDPLHFRILLSQRLLELRKEKGLPPSLPGLATGLPPSIHPSFFSHLPPFSMANLSLSHLDRENAGGLDLSMKNENDGDDSNASYIDEDSNMSGGMSPSGNRSECEDFTDVQDGHGSSSPVARPSSRRKPAAPQWVNPSWMVGEKEREVIINGVCVMQTDDYRQNNELETVLIEPTSVDEARRSILESEATSELGERMSPMPPMNDSVNVSRDDDDDDDDRPDEAATNPFKQEKVELNGNEDLPSEGENDLPEKENIRET